MYLSYTGFGVADSCLYKYWHMYINITATDPDDRTGSLYGSTTGRLFEAFYQEKLWRRKDVREILESRVEEYVDNVIRDETTATDWKRAGYIRWKDDETHPKGIYYSKEELISDVKHAVARGLNTIKTHGFVGEDAEAEKYLNTTIGGQKFGGRADFVMTLHRTGELVILDGKGSRSVHKDRYVDPRQLLWYSLLLWEKHGRFPVWTGFVFWKKDPPYNVSKHVWTLQDAQNLKQEVLTLMGQIEAKQENLSRRGPRDSVSLSVVQEEFPHTASPDNCRFCNYAKPGVCNAGAAQVEKMRRD